jgi:hypothetical protein
MNYFIVIKDMTIYSVATCKYGVYFDEGEYF